MWGMTTAELVRAYTTSLLALTVWREARGEGIEGMRAVACVVRNRVLAGWFGGSWRGNLIAKNQFTSMSVTGDGNLVLWLDPNEKLGAAALAVAASVYSGGQADVTGGALYYENPEVATSKWFIQNVRNKRPKVATIGRHTFYA